ncbi:MAG: hypothetical protein HN970_10150 [Rhodospirillaceae bacterium]|jgi:hypothetical protein|nr:hypothetical protein [Rhodospirillaceae bacterium]MBT7031226.1 hypothetical protein [Rhodospirillaceae bacterium]
MLRESNNTIGTTFDMTDVTGGVSGETDIPHADLLSAFAEAVYYRDGPLIGEKQTEIRQILGDAAFVDCAAVAAAFHGFVRVADATGIPYEGAGGGTDTADLRSEVGIDQFYRIAGE